MEVQRQGIRWRFERQSGLVYCLNMRVIRSNFLKSTIQVDEVNSGMEAENFNAALESNF